jgi:23S rRNA (pseudouridine1915-N3)-methyltransferase
MKICILLPGKIKPKQLAAAQEAYIARLKPFGVELLEYKPEKVASRPPQQTREVEAERIVKLLKEGDYLVACDERGHSITTREMAGFLEAARNGSHPLTGKRRVTLVVGGALGLADSVRQKADAVWSLSSLVMAGGIARMVLLEGLYRAFTVIEGHPYHNE